MPDEFSKPDNVGQMAAGDHAPEIVFYLGVAFNEQELRTNLNCTFARDSMWNDTISSVIVVSGTWEVFFDAYWQGPSRKLTPGYYTAGDLGEFEGQISSARFVSW